MDQSKNTTLLKETPLTSSAGVPFRTVSHGISRLPIGSSLHRAWLYRVVKIGILIECDTQQ